MDKVVFIDKVTMADMIWRIIGGGSALILIVCGAASQIREMIRRYKDERDRLQSKEKETL